VVSHDGKVVIRAEAEGPSAEAAQVGERLGKQLLDSGARGVLAQVGM
jgi:porphobilinogen deaminase